MRIGFVQGLSAQVGRADGVGLADDVRAAVLITADRKREPEREQQAHDPEKRRLQDAEGLLEAVRKVPDAAAQEDPEQGGPQDDGKEKKAQLEGRQPEEQDARPYLRFEGPLILAVDQAGGSPSQ